jgi:zinc transporter ZupT
MGVRAFIILMLISVLIFMGDVIYRAITRSSIFLDLDLWVIMGGMLIVTSLIYLRAKSFLQAKEFLNRLMYSGVSVLIGTTIGLMLVKIIYPLDKFLPLAFGFALGNTLLLFIILILAFK